MDRGEDSAAGDGDHADWPAEPRSSGELAAHLRELELRLSRMVAEPPATWNIAPLEQAAEQLLARADTCGGPRGGESHAGEDRSLRLDSTAVRWRNHDGCAVRRSHCRELVMGKLPGRPPMYPELRALPLRRTMRWAFCGPWYPAGPARRSSRSSTLKDR